MSNAEQALSGVVGGVIGFFIGGPAGAVTGFQIGLTAGAALFPADLPPVIGPRLEDFEQIQSDPGAPVMIGFGRFAVPGFRMYLGPGNTTSATEELGGKGPPSQDVTTYTSTQTLALGLCEGVIDGISRVWENGKLVYDARPRLETEDGFADSPFIEDDYNILFDEWSTIRVAAQFSDIDWVSLGYLSGMPLTAKGEDIITQYWSTVRVAALFSDIDWTSLGFISFEDRVQLNAEYEETFVLYLGDELQEADPTIELEQGVGNVPGFRGLAYLVYPNRVVKPEQGNRHPVFKVEVSTSSMFAVVSKPTRVVFYENDTWTVPADVHKIELMMVGGGAGTDVAARLPGDPAAGGGGGGEVVYYGDRQPAARAKRGGSLTVTPADVLTISVGAGGVQEGGQTDITIDAVVYIAQGGGLWGSDRPTGAGGWGNHIDSVATFIPPVFTVSADTQGYGGTVVIGPDGVPIRYGYGGPGLTYGEYIFATHLGGTDPGWTTGGAGGGGGGAGTGGAGATVGTLRGLRGGDGGQGVYMGKWFGTDLGEFGWFGAGGGGGGIYDYAETAILRQFRASFGEGGLGGGLPRSPYSIDGLPASPIDASDNIDDDTFKGTGGGGSGGLSSADACKGRSGILVINYRVIPSDGGTPFEPVPLSVIVTALAARAGLTDLDVDDLEDILVDGYVITRESTARAAIEPLRMLGLFDIVERGPTLRFPTRGKSPVVTFAADDLGVFESGQRPSASVTVRKSQDVELPRQLRIQYSSIERDYERGEQLSPSRIGTVGVNEVTVQCPIIMSDSLAAQVAEVLWRNAWVMRWSYEFSVDQSFKRLEGGDVVLCPVDSRLTRMRIIQIDESPVVRKMSAVRDDDGAYVSTAIADSVVRPPSAIDKVSLADSVILDIPALRDTDDDAGFYVAAYRAGDGNTWPGSRFAKSSDGGSVYETAAIESTEAITGNIIAATTDGDSLTFDDDAVYDVTLISGTLESRTDEALFAGANSAAVGGTGRWQIMQFGNAELIAPKTYRLTHLLLGRRGTELLIPSVLPGDSFVLVSGPGIYRVSLENAEIGRAQLYRTVANGFSVETATPVEFTATGAALKPFSPVNVVAVLDTGDLIVTWDRRDRLGQTLPSGVLVAMSESVEAYEIDVIDTTSDAVVRTLTSSTQTVTYTAAMQSTDLLAAADAAFVVYQMSSVVGRGAPGYSD